MLNKIVQTIRQSNNHIEDGTLFCKGLTVDVDITECIDFLESQGVIENTDYENKLGRCIDLELSLARLNSLGFYESRSIFVLKNLYQYSGEIFLFDIQDFLTSNSPFYIQYSTVLNLINAIKSIARHTYTDLNIEISFLFREDKSLVIPMYYSANDLCHLGEANILSIQSLVSTYNEENSEKKLMFTNELIDYLQQYEEGNRFEILLKDCSGIYDRSTNAFQYYLRNFSFNKLKLELDSKALEFTQKIQGVINDSQSKLIAIPTAFVLAFTSFDYQNPLVIKNIIAIASLFIFSYLIQLFADNQKSTLNFIESNIASYLESFKRNDIEKISNKFSIVEKELNKQNSRIGIIEILLWIIPTLLLFIWFILLINKN